MTDVECHIFWCHLMLSIGIFQSKIETLIHTSQGFFERSVRDNISKVFYI